MILFFIFTLAFYFCFFNFSLFFLRAFFAFSFFLSLLPHWQKCVHMANKKTSRRTMKTSACQEKVHKVMKEFKQGKLHSGPKKYHNHVTNPKQAVAIAMSQCRGGK